MTEVRLGGFYPPIHAAGRLDETACGRECAICQCCVATSGHRQRKQP